MSYVVAAPEMMTAAASDLATIGTNLHAAHAVAAARTLAVIPAAADEVSASIAGLFSQFAQDYQALAAEAAAFEQQFGHLLAVSAEKYADDEAVIAEFLQRVINPPYNEFILGEFVQNTITLEEGLARDVVAMPSLLLDPSIYVQGLTPIALAVTWPVWFPLGVIASLLYLLTFGPPQPLLGPPD
jgi:hypothetical protein